MKRHEIYKLIAAGMLMGMASCAKEGIFEYNPGEGALNCESLNVEYGAQQTRAQEVNGVSVNDFTVDFVDANGNIPSGKRYKYSEMPEIVTLPAGSYSVHAYYGEDKSVAWDEPYYNGELTGINITAGNITTLPENRTVECALSNIRVKVNFEDYGKGLIGNDATVKVTAGAAGNSLTFFKDKSQQEGEIGYFSHSNSQTVIAIFEGMIDGKNITSEPISFSNAEPGKSYTINFIITKPENTEGGDIVVKPGDDEQQGGATNTGIKIDHTITVNNDITIDPNPDKPHEEVIDDDMRNKSGNNQSENSNSGETE